MSWDDFSDDVLAAIRAHLTAEWSETPINWPNEASTKAAPWLAVSIARNLYSQESIGAGVQSDNRFDEEGQLLLDLAAPTGTGASKIGGAAKALAEIFKGLTLMSDRLEFGDARIGIGQPADEDGNFYVLPVSIDWRLTNA